jgi:EPP (Eye Pigment Precursor) family transporter
MDSCSDQLAVGMIQEPDQHKQPPNDEEPHHHDGGTPPSLVAVVPPPVDVNDCVDEDKADDESADQLNHPPSVPAAAASSKSAAVGTGILKTSHSSSVLAWETSSSATARRPSTIHRSLSTHFKRVSLVEGSHDDEDKSNADTGTSENTRLIDTDTGTAVQPPHPDRRRSGFSRITSYGSLYPTIYQKLTVLHRLSFADIVERITLTWENIDVYAPAIRSKLPVIRKGLSASGVNVDGMQPKHILKDVSGAVEPSTLLAVMGASGSGKTTLLNVLTYRNRGNLIVHGEVRVNGGQIGKGMSSMSGYVQQEDVFIGTLTVKEHLWFQSQLKMDREVTDDIRAERVEDVMHEMGLVKCADVMIGIPGRIKGISGGERKRLAFASEVLTNPPLLFLDEPTSGLDSYMARNILQTLKVMAAKGRTIVCTIHQPSSEVFELFDRLLLMSEGRVAYLGPAKDATLFFAGCGFRLPPNYNPADYFVHTLAVEPGNELHCREKIKIICDSYAQSPQAEHVRKVITESNFHEDGAMYDEESFPEVSPYKASWFKQLCVVFWRCWLNNMREPVIVRMRFFQITVMAFIFGLIFWQQNIDQSGVNNINGVLFLMQMQMTFGFIFNVVMTFPPEFPVFLREHFDGMYRVDVYFLCKMTAEVPQFFVLPLVFTIIMYFCIGLYGTAEGFFICFAANFLVCNVSISFGYLLSCATSNVGLALAIGPLIIVPCTAIGGFFINPESVPVYLIWLKYISWFTYANEILVVNQWQHITSISCPGIETDRSSTHQITNITQSWLSTITPGTSSTDRCFTTGQDVIDMFSYDASNVNFDFFMLVLLLVVFRFVAFLILALRARKSYKISSKKNVEAV